MGRLVIMVRGQPSERPLRLRVGVVDAIPKLLAYRLLAPVLLPTENTALRRSLDRWSGEVGVRPVTVVAITEAARRQMFSGRGEGTPRGRSRNEVRREARYR